MIVVSSQSRPPRLGMSFRNSWLFTNYRDCHFKSQVYRAPSLNIPSLSFSVSLFQTLSGSFQSLPRNLHINRVKTKTTSTAKQALKLMKPFKMPLLYSATTFAIILLSFARAQTGPGQFTLTIYQPGSPLNGQIVNAAAEAFYLGGSPATYCPLTNQTLCPVGNQTIFAGMGAMFVSKPLRCHFQKLISAIR
jgi:hypothetical protein